MLHERVLQRIDIDGQAIGMQRRRAAASDRAVVEGGGIVVLHRGVVIALIVLDQACARQREAALIKRVKKLADWIRHKLPEHSRLIIFTEYEDTKAYLVDQLKGIFPKDCDERIESFSGSTDKKNRERLKHSFNADPRKDPLRILVCTDAAR